MGQEDPLSRKWQLTSGFLPGIFQGQRNLAGYSPWGPKELDLIEHTYTLNTLLNHSHSFIHSFKALSIFCISGLSQGTGDIEMNEMQSLQ